MTATSSLAQLFLYQCIPSASHHLLLCLDKKRASLHHGGPVAAFLSNNSSNSEMKSQVLYFSILCWSYRRVNGRSRQISEAKRGRFWFVMDAMFPLIFHVSEQTHNLPEHTEDHCEQHQMCTLWPHTSITPGSLILARCQYQRLAAPRFAMKRG